MSRRRPDGVRRRVAAIALTVALGPGVGHAVLGRDRAAAAWIAVTTAAYAGAAFAAQMIWVGLGMRLVCAVELWLRGRPARPRSWIPAIAVVIAIKAALLFTLRVGWVEAYRIPASSMAPTLAVGDHLFAFKGAYWFSEPEVGDVVVFETRCRPNTVFVKRVVAVAGDRIEFRCGRMYLDDELVEQTEIGRVEIVDTPAENQVVADVARELRETARGASWRIALPIGGCADPMDCLDFPVRESFAPCGGELPHGKFVPSRGGPSDCPRSGQFEVPPGHFFAVGDNRANSFDSRTWGPIPMSGIRGRVSGVWFTKKVGTPP